MVQVAGCTPALRISAPARPPSCRLCALAQREGVSLLSDTFTATVVLGAHLLWQHRDALLHDLHQGRACAAWDLPHLAPSGLPQPAPSAVAAVDALLARMRAGCSAQDWEARVAATEEVGPLLLRLHCIASTLMACDVQANGWMRADR